MLYVVCCLDALQPDRVFFVIIGSVAVITKTSHPIKLAEGEAVGIVEYIAGAAGYMWPVLCRRKSTLYSISAAALTELFFHYPEELARMKTIAEQRLAAWTETERFFAKRVTSAGQPAPVEEDVAVRNLTSSLNSAAREGGLESSSALEMIVELQSTSRELLSTQRELLDMLRDSLFPMTGRMANSELS